jgi:protein-arginine deiminase
VPRKGRRSLAGTQDVRNTTLKASITLFADFHKTGALVSSRDAGPDAWAILLPGPEMEAVAPASAPGEAAAPDTGVFRLEWSGAGAGSSIYLKVPAPDRRFVRLLRERAGAWEDLGAEGPWTIRPTEEERAEGLTLALSALSFARPHRHRFVGWSGEFTLTAWALDSQGKAAARDRARFKTAPFLLASSLDTVEEVLVIETALTAPFVEALADVVPRAGARVRPLAFPDGTPNDVWAQDTMEVGRACAPDSAGGVRQGIAMLSGLRARHEGIATTPLDKNARQFFLSGNCLVADTADPRPKTRWIDWFGNLEVSPPCVASDGRRFPHGRILYGSQDGLAMHPDTVAFLEHQGAQGPAVEVDVSWLTIGHVDEVVNFVPGSNGFRVLIPGVAEARTLLRSLAEAGHSRAVAFAGTESETTLDCLLALAGSPENRAIEAALAETRAQLQRELGVQEEAFLPLPALFKDGLSVIPNPVNCLVCNGHVILPDPRGPRVRGVDPFQHAISEPLEAEGLTVHFVDVWEPYHVRSGEVHCATNAIRLLANPTWWSSGVVE